LLGGCHSRMLLAGIQNVRQPGCPIEAFGHDGRASFCPHAPRARWWLSRNDTATADLKMAPTTDYTDCTDFSCFAVNEIHGG
jgi:hypothetical protein